MDCSDGNSRLAAMEAKYQVQRERADKAEADAKFFQEAYANTIEQLLIILPTFQHLQHGFEKILGPIEPENDK
jgi:hypothetical protein